MKTSVARVIIAIALCVLTLRLKAQDQDYVIPVYGDTIKCTINQPFMSDHGRYQAAGMKSSKKIRIEEIKEYYVAKNKKLYRAVFKSRTNVVYMEVLENGPISLYDEFFNRTSSVNGVMYSNSSDIWYVGKGSIIVTPIDDYGFSVSNLFAKRKKQRINEFTELIRDNKIVYDKFIADNTFDNTEIRNIIHLYNTGEPFQEKK
ncbi:MAG: hypothetical protein ACXVJD_04200 [Mucilaginibacter sp.]